MSTISTHVLDTSLGKPAPGIRVTLNRNGAEVGSSETDPDGRARDLLSPNATLEEGEYTLGFDVAAYFASSGRQTFYTHIDVRFKVTRDGGHYHVPLLLSPFGYATYRGS